MALKKIPLKLLTTKYGNQEKFNYLYVDAMKPKNVRLQKWLKEANEGPIWINWEGYPKFDKDLRELVKKGALKLVRHHISTCRNMSKLHITNLGQDMIK